MEDSKVQHTQSRDAEACVTSEELLDLFGSPTMPSLPAVVDFSMVKNKAAESVTEYSSNYVWCVGGGSGRVNGGSNKTNAYRVRPCVACAAN